MKLPDLVDLPSLPAYVRDRWPLAMERAADKAQSTVPDPRVHQLIKASQRASTASQRIVWLHRAASAWAAPMEATSGCRNGCSHCCHISVTISKIAADMLSPWARRSADERRLSDDDITDGLWPVV
jgi:hypothetical protein